VPRPADHRCACMPRCCVCWIRVLHQCSDKQPMQCMPPSEDLRPRSHSPCGTTCMHLAVVQLLIHWASRRPAKCDILLSSQQPDTSMASVILACRLFDSWCCCELSAWQVGDQMLLAWLYKW
jgi:hypothetical protein